MNCYIVSRNFVKNKWNLTYNYLLVWGNRLQGFLNDPATIHLQSQGQDVSTDTCCQSQLLVCTSKLTNTKQTPFSTDATEQKSLYSNKTEMTARLTLNCPNLKELLDDVIPKHISHQLVCCLQNLSEHHLPLSRSGSFKLLLDESRQTRLEEERWKIKIPMQCTSF